MGSVCLNAGKSLLFQELKNANMTITKSSSSLFPSLSHFYLRSRYDDIRLLAGRLYTSPHRQSLLPEICSHAVQTPLRQHSLPPSASLRFYSHLPTSFIILLSSHHITAPSQPPFLYFCPDFPHFHCSSNYCVSYPIKL